MKEYAYINKSKCDIKILEITKRKRTFFVTLEFKKKYKKSFFDVIIECELKNKNFFSSNLLTYENMDILDIRLYKLGKDNNAIFSNSFERLFFIDSLDEELRKLKIIIKE